MISRRKFLSRIAASAGAGMLAGSSFSCIAPKPRPNIILFFIDDLGWKDLSFMGSDYYETPNIDRLAEQGMVFTQAYSNAPNCAPTRACLMTGQYSPRHGIYTVGSSERGKSENRKIVPIQNKTTLDPDFPSFAKLLHKDGYVTASIGKWHLGDDPVAGPLAHGFDVNVGGNHRGSPHQYFSPYQSPDLPKSPEGEYLTDHLSEEAVQFIDANHQKPFFLYFPHFAVHTPLQAKEELIKKYKAKSGDQYHHHATYAAMIQSVDEGVGKILEALDQYGISENTIVILNSDNGGYGPATSMHPLRGSKGMLYEGGIRVPLVFHWPGQVRPTTICDSPVITLDLYPTILEMAGVAPDSEHALDGKSLLPLLEEKERWAERTLYWHFPAYLEAYRRDGGPWRTTPAGAIRKGEWKLIEFFEDHHLELYHLGNDIGETDNLAELKPDIVKELLDEMRAWRKEVNAPVPTKLNLEYIATGL